MVVFRQRLLMRFGLPDARLIFAATVMPLGLGACSSAPTELAGLWSVGDAACADRRGLTFDSGVVTAHFGTERMALLDGARYDLRRDAQGLEVRIRHTLPEAPGGVSAAPGQGELVLRQGADGWLRPVAQRFADGLTGSVRLPLHGVGFATALTVRRCQAAGAETSQQKLKGRGGA